MKTKVSIKTRMILFSVAITLVLSGSIGYIGYRNYYSNILEKYKEYAETIVRMEETVLQNDEFAEIVSCGEMDDRYEDARIRLNSIKDNSNIDYIYALYFEDSNDTGSMKYVINGVRKEDLAEAESERDVYSYLGEKCEEGDFEENMKSAFLASINEKSEDYNYIVNDTSEYGYQLTCYKILYGNDGVAVVMAIDTSMDAINKNLKSYISSVLMVALVIFIVFTALFIIVTNKNMIKPITQISESSFDFVEQIKNEVAPLDLTFNSVPVKKNDEIKVLSTSIDDMVNSLKSYMVNLEKVNAEKGRITAELNVATSIQANMLPSIFPPFPERNEFDIYASMKPAKEVGGDFYDFYLIDDDHLCVTIADVSGKGVPAALFMVIAKTLLKDHVLMGKEPMEVFETVNKILCENNENSMFVTAWLSIYEISTGKLTSVNAGHDYPLIYHDGKFEFYEKKGGFVLAGMEGVKYRQFETYLEKGDVMLLYTDGIPEAINSSEEEYTCKRLEECVNRTAPDTMQKLIESVTKDVNGFVGEVDQFDDMTMLALKAL